MGIGWFSAVVDAFVEVWLVCCVGCFALLCWAERGFVSQRSRMSIGRHVCISFPLRVERLRIVDKPQKLRSVVILWFGLGFLVCLYMLLCLYAFLVVGKLGCGSSL